MTLRVWLAAAAGPGTQAGPLARRRTGNHGRWDSQCAADFQFAGSESSDWHRVAELLSRHSGDSRADSDGDSMMMIRVRVRGRAGPLGCSDRRSLQQLTLRAGPIDRPGDPG